MVVISQGITKLLPSRQIVHSTQQVVYLAHANMHANQGLYNTWTLDWTGPWTGLWTGPWAHSYLNSDLSISLYHSVADLQSLLIQDAPHLNNIYDKRLMKSFHGADADDDSDRFYLAS